MLLKKFSKAGKNSVAFPLSPNRPFNWDEAICIAAAVEKPATTGLKVFI